MKNNLTIKFALLRENARAPMVATDGSAGFDLACSTFERATQNSITIGTGVAVEIPKGYVGLLFARSSISKRPLILSNGVGVIDSDYRGEIKANFKKTNNDILSIYRIGEYCCQLVIVKLPDVEFIQVDEASLSFTQRGIGGYGSTDNR